MGREGFGITFIVSQNPPFGICGGLMDGIFARGVLHCINLAILRNAKSASPGRVAAMRHGAMGAGYINTNVLGAGAPLAAPCCRAGQAWRAPLRPVRDRFAVLPA